jgi:hypothetical protein
MSDLYEELFSAIDPKVYGELQDAHSRTAFCFPSAARGMFSIKEPNSTAYERVSGEDRPLFRPNLVQASNVDLAPFDRLPSAQVESVGQNISLSDVADQVVACFGVRHDRRNYPSAGGCYPVQVFLGACENDRVKVVHILPHANGWEYVCEFSVSDLCTTLNIDYQHRPSAVMVSSRMSG